MARSNSGLPLVHVQTAMQLHVRNLARYFVVWYEPDAQAGNFRAEALEQERDGYCVRVAVPDARAAQRYFGVPVARHGIQPVWIAVSNGTSAPCRLQCVALDPEYFSPLEAAAVCHFSGLRRLLGYGVLAWLFLPVLLLMSAKLLTVGWANRRMDTFFREQAFRLRPVPSGGEQSGFVYATRSEGTKTVLVRLLAPQGTIDFEFALAGQGLKADHLRRGVADLAASAAGPDLDAEQVQQYLTKLPATTTDVNGRRQGDPVNLVIVGEFDTILSVFSVRWDETEVISLGSCWRTVRAFLTGAEYRYSPVSALFLFERSQDLALQRVRNSINERLHLRLWRAPVRFRGQPIWVGQVSRDIGVRLTRHTWNLMTHRIDPDVDEARDYVVEDLMHLGRVTIAAYVDGVGACEPNKPRRNLTGDPYHTDGKRAAILLAESRTKPTLVAMFGAHM